VQRSAVAAGRTDALSSQKAPVAGRSLVGPVRPTRTGSDPTREALPSDCRCPYLGWGVTTDGGAT
jgi:hypothetical protein